MELSIKEIEELDAADLAEVESRAGQFKPGEDEEREAELFEQRQFADIRRRHGNIL